jgi:hypothetical protein
MNYFHRERERGLARAGGVPWIWRPLPRRWSGRRRRRRPPPRPSEPLLACRRRRLWRGRRWGLTRVCRIGGGSRQQARSLGGRPRPTNKPVGRAMARPALCLSAQRSPPPASMATCEPHRAGGRPSSAPPAYFSPPLPRGGRTFRLLLLLPHHHPESAPIEIRRRAQPRLLYQVTIIDAGSPMLMLGTRILVSDRGEGAWDS